MNSEIRSSRELAEVQRYNRSTTQLWSWPQIEGLSNQKDMARPTLELGCLPFVTVFRASLSVWRRGDWPTRERARPSICRESCRNASEPCIWTLGSCDCWHPGNRSALKLAVSRLTRILSQRSTRWGHFLLILQQEILKVAIPFSKGISQRHLVYVTLLPTLKIVHKFHHLRSYQTLF